MASKSARDLIKELESKALEAIEAIREKLKTDTDKHRSEALADLKQKRKETQAVLDSIDEEIAELTGKSQKTRRSGHSAGNGKAAFADTKELKGLLSKAEGKKLNRKGFLDAGYSLKSALVIAREDKATFGFEQKGAQGSVWLR